MSGFGVRVGGCIADVQIVDVQAVGRIVEAIFIGKNHPRLINRDDDPGFIQDRHMRGERIQAVLQKQIGFFQPFLRTLLVGYIPRNDACHQPFVGLNR